MAKKLRLVVTADATTWKITITDYRWATADGNGVIFKEVTGNRDGDEAIGQWIQASVAEYLGIESKDLING
jgi:hypothetical protein